MKVSARAGGKTIDVTKNNLAAFCLAFQTRVFAIKWWNEIIRAA